MQAINNDKECKQYEDEDDKPEVWLMIYYFPCNIEYFLYKMVL